MESETKIPIEERYKLLIEDLGLNPKRFAETISVSSTIIYSIVGGKSKPGFDILEKTIETYPEYKDFMISGVGELKNQKKNPNTFGEEVTKGFEKLFREQLAIKDEQLAKKDEQLAIKDQHISKLLNMMPLGKDDLSGVSLRVTYKREMGRVMPLWNFLVTSPLTVGQQ